uniref:Uncharacterized protein n=1 Tax=Mycena chlorophos TaxID=658473 RepID=A0ABQ0L3I0_MYCCL|nr:predicted protein [Mycena chlorophos]
MIVFDFRPPTVAQHNSKAARPQLPRPQQHTLALREPLRHYSALVCAVDAASHNAGLARRSGHTKTIPLRARKKDRRNQQLDEGWVEMGSPGTNFLLRPRISTLRKPKVLGQCRGPGTKMWLSRRKIRYLAYRKPCLGIVFGPTTFLGSLPYRSYVVIDSLYLFYTKIWVRAPSRLCAREDQAVRA